MLLLRAASLGFLLTHWEIQTRSTWQSRCVLRGCVGVGVMRHAYHLAQILRAQATRSQVSSRSVVTESICSLVRL